MCSSNVLSKCLLWTSSKNLVNQRASQRKTIYLFSLAGMPPVQPPAGRVRPWTLTCITAMIIMLSGSTAQACVPVTGTGLCATLNPPLHMPTALAAASGVLESIETHAVVLLAGITGGAHVQGCGSCLECLNVSVERIFC